MRAVMKSKSRSGKSATESSDGAGGGGAGAGQAMAFRRSPRKNGWSCPAHVLQFVAWFFLLSFNVLYHGVVVPVLPYEWQPAGYIIVGLAVLCHVIAHVTCLTINPGDPSTFKRKKKEMPTFDRKQHAHVIENNHCYLCEVNVDKSSKHCSACNKCVIGFDHHCKWLNNCIGSRNYRVFIACLLTAFISCFIVFGIALYVVIVYWVKPVLLHPAALQALRAGELYPCQLYSATPSAIAVTAVATTQATPCDFHENLRLFVPVSGKAFISVVIILAVLLLISLALLGHLLSFHMYLISQGLGTYDYIMRVRSDEEDPKNDAKPSKDDRCCSSRRGGKVAPAKDGSEDIELRSTRKEISEGGRETSVTNNGENTSVDIPRETAVVIHQEGKESKASRPAGQRSKKKKKKRTTPRALPAPPPLNYQTNNANQYHRPAGNHPVLAPLASTVPYGEGTWALPNGPGGMAGAGMGQSETYIEQHIVRRFSIPIAQPGGATPMPYPLHTSTSVNELVPVSARSMTQAVSLPRAPLPPLRQISMDPPTPALDYHSSSAESLHELAASENAGTLKKLQGATDLAASFPPAQQSPARVRGQAVGQAAQKSDAGESKKKKLKLKLRPLKVQRKKSVPHEADVGDTKPRRSSMDGDHAETAADKEQTEPAAPTVPLLDLSGVTGEEDTSHRDDAIPPGDNPPVLPEDKDILYRANRRRSLMMR